MNSREAGFLLLTSQLGNPDRKVLTVAQLRTLAQRSRNLDLRQPQRELNLSDLQGLGYGRGEAHRILSLLSERELLEYYLLQGQKAGCTPLTRVTQGYPLLLRKRLGLDTPGCLWAKGDLSLLELPAVALVGSRELQAENADFAREVGRQAALQGYVLISGNARGADKTAQEACLAAGGKVISVVADGLREHRLRENVLYLSEDGFDLAFTAQRAISRNRCIHSLGRMTFVAQCGYRQGGTWDGTVKNLRFGWSDVFVFADGSPAMDLLTQMGATAVHETKLQDFAGMSTMTAGQLVLEEMI